MALLKPEEIAPEGDEQRQDIIAKAITSKAPNIPGFVARRHMTPLAMVALMLVKNPYVAKDGFLQMGFEIEDGVPKNVDAHEFGIAMMQKVAEVLAVLTCETERLKIFADNADALRDSAKDILEETEQDVLLEAMNSIGEQLFTISKTQATRAPEEQGNPESSTLNGGNGKSPKRRARTGLHKS